MPREYGWSAWRVYAGLEPAPSWLTQDRIRTGGGGRGLQEQRAALILGRKWAEMAEGYGDWGRDGTVAVATRHLGWRLVEVVGQVRGLKYATAAQGIGRFWRRAEQRPQLAESARRLKTKVSKVNV